METIKSKLSTVRLMQISLLRFFKTFQKYLAYTILYAIYFFTAIILLSNAILCAIYFITAINLPNAIFWLMRLFPSPSIDLL